MTTLSITLLTVLITLLSVSNAQPHECTHPLYCTGNLLHTVQTYEIFKDSKTFVDRPLTTSTDEEFRRLFAEISHSTYTKQLLTEFVEKYTNPVGYEVDTVIPEDFTPNPQFLSKIKSKPLIPFLSDLHARWKHLLRKVNQEKITCPMCSSIIPTPHPYIVPGGRFNEMYYWDGYWVILGLLASDMTITARGMINNYAFFIDKYGFIPNGNRIYYLNRSQPPLFALMVYEYYKKTGDIRIIKENYPHLQKEYNLWMNPAHGHVVNIQSGNKIFPLNRFFVDVNSPRPEGYREDLNIIAKKANLTVAEKAALYGHIAAGAESGWDFSSRWLNDTTGQSDDLSDLMTTKIIPIDLNAILYRYEAILSIFATQLDDRENARYYYKQSQIRKEALFTLAWNKQHQRWFDLVISPDSYTIDKMTLTTTTHLIKKNMTSGEIITYPSQYYPIWAGLHHLPYDGAYQLLSNVLRTLLLRPGGIITSMAQKSTQQWDGTNAWAPLQYFIAEGLITNSPSDMILPTSPEANVMTTWMYTTYCGWKDGDNGKMYEKYDADQIGQHGGGGEYDVVEDGFGWTNGYVLYIADKYPYLFDAQFTPKC